MDMSGRIPNFPSRTVSGPAKPLLAAVRCHASFAALPRWSRLIMAPSWQRENSISPRVRAGDAQGVDHLALVDPKSLPAATAAPKVPVTRRVKTPSQGIPRGDADARHHLAGATNAVSNDLPSTCFSSAIRRRGRKPCSRMNARSRLATLVELERVAIRRLPVSLAPAAPSAFSHNRRTAESRVANKSLTFCSTASSIHISKRQSI